MPRVSASPGAAVLYIGFLQKLISMAGSPLPFSKKHGYELQRTPPGPGILNIITVTVKWLRISGYPNTAASVIQFSSTQYRQISAMLASQLSQATKLNAEPYFSSSPSTGIISFSTSHFS
ncbi:hypothetical protein RIF29_20739 [Crotalaria pallida]|uniref:Uncharacterized protein n=1 Tax=Crotalaria pallida TaxID=3830 RepID=A0AAN9F430_CROPI